MTDARISPLWYHAASTIMTPTRVVAYLGVGVLTLAWLSSAAGVGEQSHAPQSTPQPVQTAGTETLASDVQAQAARLRARLATAPTPQFPHRNPFAFAPRPEPRAARTATTVAPAPIALPDPPLMLVGIAEDKTPTGQVRTAILTAEGGEMFIVKVGEAIGARYTVSAIGTDAIELIDLMTNSQRRIALR
jgi:hypothetical protein